MNFRYLFGVAALFISLSCQAEFYSGNALLRLMSGQQVEQDIATGYVAGVADAHAGIIWCGPPQVSVGQIRDVVKKYLEQYPEKRHFAADSNVAVALRTVWPCKK